jgi:ferredoxin
MSTEIYFFSGTGNSLFVSREIKRLIPDAEMIPIVRALKENNYATKAENVGFVFPTHGMTVPFPVRLFLKRMDTASASYFFAVATRGGTVFKGFPIIRSELRRQGKRLNASFLVDMASNDPKLSFYCDPTNEELGLIEAKAFEKINEIARKISNKEEYNGDDKTGETFSRNPLLNSLLEKLIPFVTHFLLQLMVKNYFYADFKCTGCGICEKVCPSQKIIMQDGLPLWQKDMPCYFCYACLNYCPSKSVQIYSKIWMKSYTTKKGRYSHTYATSDDIAQQKYH